MLPIVLLVFLVLRAQSASLGKIVGGQDAPLHKFPFIVSLRWTNGTINKHYCGGSIINPEWIITAGHCVTMVPEAGRTLIVAGINYLDDPQGQSVEIEETFVHPKYLDGIASFDIALLKLATPIKYSEIVKPIRVANPQKRYEGPADFAGWGVMEDLGLNPNAQPPNSLQSAHLYLINYEECNKIFTDSFGEEPLGPENVCSGPLEGGLSPCNGDSGGPLSQDGVLIGVASWVVAPCGVFGAPTVYAGVANFIEFISQYTGDFTIDF